MSSSRRRLSLLQVVCAAGLSLVCLAALAHAVFFSRDVPFIRRAGGPSWIAAPMATTSNLIGVDPSAVPIYTFVKRFSAEARGDAALLEVRALRSLDLRLNGDPIRQADPPADWRHPLRVDIGDRLRPGRNELRVEVQNPRGPALLQLRLDFEGTTLESDTSWSVIAPGANPTRAVIADDRRVHPDSRLLAEPGQILRERALPVALLFVGSALAWLAASRWLSERTRQRLPRITLAAVTLFWLALFAFKTSRLTLMVGFDVPAHLGYIDFILTRNALPLASDGFSSYHPPAFHLLTSLLVSVFDVSRQGGGQAVYRIFTFAPGLANVWLTYFVARRLWPKDSLKTSLAVATAGLLPMNIYMSAYVSNEPLHAAWVSLALFLAIRLLLAERMSTCAIVSLSAVLGLALLTKFTSLIIAPLVAGVVACKVWLVEERPIGRALRVLATLVAGAALISGWFYLRNWLVFGDPVVWNLDVPGAPTWWMQPGFHTAAYYTGFGEALRHPFFAGFHSFWDGIYSTLWGDGLVGGMIRVGTRHRMWNYDFMTLCYWLALPATLLMAVGATRLVRASLAGGDLGRRLAFSLTSSLLFLLAFSLFYVSFSLPFYAQAKSFYALAAVMPLALAGAEGLALIPQRLGGRRHEPIRAIYFGWLGTLAGVIATTYLG